MNNELKINDWVERLGSVKDYTTGRKGVVVEINGERLRVRWYFEKDGKKVFQGFVEPKNWKGVRTWVNKKFLTQTSKPLNF